MSADTETNAQAEGAENLVEELSLLDKALVATKHTERSQAEALLRSLTEEALKGTVTFDKNLTVSVTKAIEAIDAKLSQQLGAIMHSDKFRKLEGSWRGMSYLVMNSETSSALKLKVLNVSQRDLAKDLERAVEFDQSQFFKKLYENEFGMPGGEPYGALVGDFEFTKSPEDMDLLRNISSVAAASFCPFLSAADPTLLGFDRWTELSKPRDLEKIFESPEYIQWRDYRDSEDARFVCLTMPRTLARLPYGADTKPIEEFDFEETSRNRDGSARALSHDEYCWMNSAYVLGGRLTEAFALHGWCTAIRGAEGGGKVEGLPAHVFTSDDGDLDLKCPTEIGITDRRENELSRLGFLPLCHYKNTNYSVFFGGQTTQKPKKYDRPAATENAAISARLPYLMAASRFAHYLKVMARDKIGSFMEVSDAEKWLNRWINNYVAANADIGPDLKAKYPLAEARVEVKEIPGQPGAYNAIAWMRPWLQLEELTTSLRMVARIPDRS